MKASPFRCLLHASRGSWKIWTGQLTTQLLDHCPRPPSLLLWLVPDQVRRSEDDSGQPYPLLAGGIIQVSIIRVFWLRAHGSIKKGRFGIRDVVLRCVPGLPQQHGSPLQQPFLGLLQRHTRPRRGCRACSVLPHHRDAVWHPGHTTRKFIYVSFLCDAHASRKPDLLRSPSGPEQELGWWEGPTLYALTGMRTSFERQCNTSFPSLTMTRSLPRTATSWTTQRSAHSKVFGTAYTTQWPTFSTKPSRNQGVFLKNESKAPAAPLRRRRTYITRQPRPLCVANMRAGPVTGQESSRPVHPRPYVPLVHHFAMVSGSSTCSSSFASFSFESDLPSESSQKIILELTFYCKIGEIMRDVCDWNAVIS